MDRIEKTSNAIKDINEFRNGKISEAQLTTNICEYFDFIKERDLTPSDLKFLKYVSNIVGIPHYYDLLIKTFQKESEEISDFNLNTLSSLIYECTLYVDDNIKLHKHQMSILDRFEVHRQNRIFLSASTSFGKTYLVYEIIKKMKYQNIVLMFPTIALLSENLEKLRIDNYYQYFRDNYKIHTLSQIDEEELADNNLFIFTPERYLSFLDRNEGNISFDFIFMDEIYKIDNEYIIDNDEAKENERDTAYRVSLYNALKNDTDVLLVGPYIGFDDQKKQNYNPSFDNFIQINNFQRIDYNEYEIVNKQRILLNVTQLIKDRYEVKITKSMSKKEKLSNTIQALVQTKENCIVYCLGAGTAENKAKETLPINIHNSVEDSNLQSLLEHIKNNFRDNWVVVNALEKGIGIHHGLVPKYIQKEIISLFNNGKLNILFSTTTITEGVNTSAKNLIVFDHKKGDKDLKKFDAKNIEGRAGRFMHHFSGSIFIIDPQFNDIINSQDIGIKHKNYDENSPKDQIDYFITEEKYLNRSQIEEKFTLLDQMALRKIPIELFNAYKVINYSDKIKLYDLINNITPSQDRKIKKLISSINGEKVRIDFDGFDEIISLLSNIVHNADLLNMMTRKKKSPIDQKEHFVLTFLLHSYLTYGFKGLIDYKIDEQKIDVDIAMRDASRFVYNTLKYQLVKYLGIFNILYKYLRSTKENSEIGIDKLLAKLEYNAFSKIGKVASDYGVPYKIVEYYDSLESNPKYSELIQAKFDNFERKSFENFAKILGE